MTDSMAWLANAMADRIGWMLLHSVWQLTLIAIACAIVLRLLPVRASNARYVVGWLALLAMVIAPALTFAGVGLNDSGVVRLIAERLGVLRSLLGRRILPGITIVWFLGVTFFCARLCIGLVAIRGLRRDLSEITYGVATIAHRMAARLGVQRVITVAESGRIHVPMTIGYLRPLVLFPAACLSGLSTQETQFLLAHELAHIRRHDYLQNIVQCVIEGLLFYHPAMWWVSSVVRREREYCCDDLVLGALEDPANYARTLLAVEQRRTSYSLAQAATDGPLLRRVQRMLGSSADSESSREWNQGIAGLVLLLVVGSALAFGMQPEASTARGASAKIEMKFTVEVNAADGGPATRDELQKPSAGEESGSAKSRLLVAERHFQRLEELYRKGAVSSEEYLAAKEQMELCRAEASGDVEQVKQTKVAAAERRFERMETLYKSGLVSRAEYEDAKDRAEAI
jgi:beta-lactamase regulating signal transducer with metallopeptidase domain